VRGAPAAPARVQRAAGPAGPAGGAARSGREDLGPDLDGQLPLHGSGAFATPVSSERSPTNRDGWRRRSGPGDRPGLRCAPLWREEGTADPDPAGPGKVPHVRQALRRSSSSAAVRKRRRWVGTAANGCRTGGDSSTSCSSAIGRPDPPQTTAPLAGVVRWVPGAVSGSATASGARPSRGTSASWRPATST